MSDKGCIYIDSDSDSKKHLFRLQTLQIDIYRNHRKSRRSLLKPYRSLS